MSNFSIGQFGSLTANGKILKFEDFDKDKDGKITEDEYNSVLQENKLDKVELSTVDKDNNKEISEDEFKQWEVKIAMQEEVNKLAGTISKDFGGKTKANDYIKQLQEDLKAYIEEFATEHTEDDDVVDLFKEELPAKYNELKSTILANDPQTIRSKVLDTVINGLQDNNGQPLDVDTQKAMGKLLEKEADLFIKEYKGTNLAEDLKTHLEEYLTKSDADKMSDDVKLYNNAIKEYGVYIDSDEFNEIKANVKEFLEAAIKKGVTINLGGKNIKTSESITSALSKYTDADTLLNDMKNAINALGTLNLKDATIAKVKADAETAEYKQLSEIKGSAYQINAGVIDYSRIYGYSNNSKITAYSKNNVKEKGDKLLSNDALKSQLRTQIEKMLQEKGISFDKIATVFENVYNQSIRDTLNNPHVVLKLLPAFFRIETKTCVDTFITTFNTNIEKAINEMYASDKDMDLIDINYSDIIKNEDGSTVTDANNNDFAKLYASGQTVSAINKGVNYYKKIAEQLVNNLKKTILSKAKAMCTANGIEFDNTVFESMFNNAKSSAIKLYAGGTNCGGLCSFSSLNVKALVDIFTRDFKTNYTTWVESEKAGNKKV